MNFETVKNIILNNFNNNYEIYVYAGQIFILCYLPYLYLCMVVVSFVNVVYNNANSEYEVSVSFSSKEKIKEGDVVAANTFEINKYLDSDSEGSGSILFDSEQNKEKSE